mmetsp:Transcript_13384/g.38203  ORF Transcript_13384/g.38203 Transcript_13384/m.38203 type:complete len:93 (+) Transcript_13384:1783-2061(+)
MTFSVAELASLLSRWNCGAWHEVKIHIKFEHRILLLRYRLSVGMNFTNTSRRNCSYFAEQANWKVQDATVEARKFIFDVSSFTGAYKRAPHT